MILQAFLVPFMLAFHVEPDDEPFLGFAFRVIDLQLVQRPRGGPKRGIFAARYFLMDIVVTFLTGRV